MIVKNVFPATEKQQTWDLLNGTPLVEYKLFEGRLFRLQFEMFDD